MAANSFFHTEFKRVRGHADYGGTIKHLYREECKRGVLSAWPLILLPTPPFKITVNGEIISERDLRNRPEGPTVL